MVVKMVLNCAMCCMYDIGLCDCSVFQQNLRLIKSHMWLILISPLEFLISEATPSAIQFLKRAYKINHSSRPDYKLPELLCLALPPRQKLGLILVIYIFFK